MADAGGWQRLARLIEDDDEVVRVVSDAVEQGDDPWEALLDGLDEAGALAYLQADDTGMELTDALAQLPRVYAAQPNLDAATDTDELDAATRIADAMLSTDLLRLVLLVEDDDAWPLVVLPAERVAEIVALAADLGHEVRPGG